MTLTKVSPQCTYALVVGIEKYNAGPSWDLDGPVNDARNFANWLCSRGVPPKNVFLFLSPLDKNQNSKLASPKFAEQEALQQNISRTITDVLPQKQGDLLYIFWGGHGIITAAGERRLFYADATQKNKRNLDLESLLLSLRSDFLCSFPRQIYIVDACANYIADPRLPIVAGETFSSGPPRKGCAQFVLLAAKTGEVAKNDSKRRTGLFSAAIMEELAEADSSWPPDMEKLANNIESRFERLRQLGSVQQTPTYLWFRDWDESEDTRGNVFNPTPLKLHSRNLLVTFTKALLGSRDQASDYTRSVEEGNPWKSSIWRSFWTLLLASIVVTSISARIRQTGILQPLELKAFDQLIRQRSAEQPDPRLLLVTVTDTDIQNRKESELSDRTIAQLLEKLESHQPRIIGLDIFRDFAIGPDRADLAPHFLSPRLIAVCGVSDRSKVGISPPPEVPTEHLGFSNVVVDNDGILRRQLLSIDPSPKDPCVTTYAFSLQLALKYLAVDNILPKPSQEYLQLNNTIFKPLKARMGGYQQLDDRGHQLLLNYRRDRIANQVTLTEVLEGKVKPDWVKDRIVIIGYSAFSKKDAFYTPFTTKHQQNEQMPGVIVHAQMTSHILSAVLDERPLLWVWPAGAEVVWIWGWAFVGGVIAWGYRLSLLRLVIVGATLGILYLLCFGLFLQGGWVPLVPSAF